MFVLLTLQIAAFSIFPLYFTTLSGPIRQVHFYVYISLVLLIGGFWGNIYSLQVADGVVVSGGNLCYGAFMMTAVMFVWIERNAFILRHLVRLVFVVDVFNIIISFLTQSVLKADGVINPHNVPPALFEVSTALIALGGVLIVTELLLLLYIFELTKKRKPSLPIAAAIYILSFVLVLILDGVAFPFIAFGINAQIAAIVFGGLAGKVLIAAAFGIPLALFVLWKRQAFVGYLEADTVRWRLLASSSSALIKEMARKDQDVRRGDVVFKSSTDGLAIVDSTGAMLKANAAFRRMLDIGGGDDDRQSSLKDAFWSDGKPISLPQSLTDMWRREVMFGPDGSRPGILSITPAGEDAEGGETYVYSLIDITEQKSTQERLEYLASRDQLTGLVNRRALDQRLAGLHDTPFALIIVDLDHFKDVNDSYGHGAGDRVLKVVASRLDTIRRDHLKPEDILCRIGGDEFALLIHSGDGDFINGIIERIQQALGQTVRIDDGLEVFSSATLGVSYKARPGDRDALLEADAALYEAKRNRRGSVGIYEDRLTADSQRKMKLGVKLKKALADNILEVHYQPQFDAVSHRLCGVEALARWTDPELGVIPPCDFIPVAEGTSLIEAVGEYVLERACRDGQEWLRNGYAPITVSVNISASQVRFGSFVSVLSKTLAETGFPAHNLQIEITESSYIERENEVTPILKELKDMGISIAIDDFGTGYSSFSYLREMPWDCIKIDRSFITNIPRDAQQCGLASMIIRLAKVMSFKVVAEGVETREQLDSLTAWGCDLIQGYYFSKALPKDGLVSMLPRLKEGADLTRSD
ncbi:bifunctional diguanylate cyclase/phosphodiesterase [Pleomorphomonas sp. JP5]|uniref:putative bifunctional diguanylate cyclase/phosphodiesterase n=1 Tax=Pleomorphomonas sp. JP5 TaxID=2942998 RepID=UPI0020445CC1|nr:EAL domain-containing protein [Pleomorphomonas sp. JP5]MCM5560024.1 EAL domain-containing protein [Pleomorphomonas sp. JP5]